MPLKQLVCTLNILLAVMKYPNNTLIFENLLLHKTSSLISCLQTVKPVHTQALKVKLFNVGLHSPQSLYDTPKYISRFPLTSLAVILRDCSHLQLPDNVKSAMVFLSC